MLTRREVIEHLITVWGVREPVRLRRLTREFLAYRARWHAAILQPAISRGENTRSCGDGHLQGAAQFG